MHVLCVSHYGGLYGANRSLIDLILALRDSGVRSTVLLRRLGPVVAELERSGVPYLSVPFEKSVHRRGTLSWFGAAYRHTTNILVARRHLDPLRRLEIDAVHTNSSATSFGWLLSELLHVPHVWHVRESLAQHYALHHDFGNRVFERRLAASACAIPISRFVSDEVLKRLTEDKKQIIHDGVFSAAALARLVSAPRPRCKGEKFTFAIIGGLEPGKNQLDAIRAAGRLARGGSDFRLLVVGDGSAEYTRQLRAEIDLLELSDFVELTGYVQDVETIYARTDAVTVCAQFEGLGRVTIEAMARGIPVIGCASGATRELIDTGVNGLLYTGDHEELARCMGQLLQEPASSDRLTRHPTRDMQCFTTEHCAEEFRQLLLRIVQKNQPRRSSAPAQGSSRYPASGSADCARRLPILYR